MESDSLLNFRSRFIIWNFKFVCGNMFLSFENNKKTPKNTFISKKNQFYRGSAADFRRCFLLAKLKSINKTKTKKTPDFVSTITIFAITISCRTTARYSYINYTIKWNIGKMAEILKKINLSMATSHTFIKYYFLFWVYFLCIIQFVKLYFVWNYQ